MLQLVAIALSIWLSWLFSSFNAPVVPSKVEWTVRLLSVAFALCAVVFIYLYMRWLRRVALIVQVSKLVHELSDGGDTVSLQTPDSTECIVRANGDGLTIHLADALHSLVYEVDTDTMFSIHRERDIWLDETNSVYGPVLRWISLDNTATRSVNERQVARRIRTLLKSGKVIKGRRHN